MLASSGGLRVSRDGGVRWTAVAKPPPGAPVAVFGAPYREPVLVTSQGVFRVGTGGRSFAAVDGAPSGAIGAELLAGSDRRPVLEVKTADTDFRWDGRSWSGRRRAVLAGGVFVAEANAAAPTDRLQLASGRQREARSGRKAAAASRSRAPAPGLALATAAAAPGGRVYVGTTGRRALSLRAVGRSRP